MPTQISIRATERPTRIEMSVAGKAIPIHIAAVRSSIDAGLFRLPDAQGEREHPFSFSVIVPGDPRRYNYATL